MPVNTELLNALKVAKTKPMFFAFVAKGNEGKLLVDKKKIPAKNADAAKKECGGGAIFKGRCLMENGTMVFEVSKEPPAALAALIKKIIKSDAALTMDVEVRINVNLDEGEPGEAGAAGIPAPAAPPAPPAAATSIPAAPPAPPAAAPTTSEPSAGAVMKRLNALTADIKIAMAGPNKAAVQTRFVAVNTSIKNNDFAGANKTLDELEGLVKGAPPMSESKSPGTDGKLSIVKLGKARIEWGQLASKAVADIGKMMELIQEEFGDDAAQKGQLATAKKRVEGLIAKLHDELSPALDDVLNGQDDNQRKPLIERAKGMLTKFVKIVQSDPIMTKLDGNEVMPEMKICAPMQGKLQEIAAALG